MTKNQRNILMGVGVLILLYLWWSNSRQPKGRTANPNGNGNGNGGVVVENCTNTCCSAVGNAISPAKFPSCDCPESDYVF